MPRGTTYMRHPEKGGRTIPDSIKKKVEERIQKTASEYFAGKYSRIEIRFKGEFCYIDAFQEPTDADYKSMPKNWSETKEEFFQRLRETPTHLCRLRYFGKADNWGYAFYSYSNEKYKLSVFRNGSFYGKPEEAFMQSANAYLR